MFDFLCVLIHIIVVIPSDLKMIRLQYKSAKAMQKYKEHLRRLEKDGKDTEI